MSVGVLAVAYLVANVVPFFEELTALIGAAIGAPISFGLPAAFALRAAAQVSHRGREAGEVGTRREGGAYECSSSSLNSGLGLLESEGGRWERVP